MFTTEDNGIKAGDFGTPMTQKRPSEPANAAAEATAKNKANAEELGDSPSPTPDGDKPDAVKIPDAAAQDKANKAAEEASEDKPKSDKEKSDKDKTNKEQPEDAGNKKNSPLEVTFKNKEPKPENAKPKEDSPSVSAEQVLQFLKTNNPALKEVESLNDISKKVKLPEPVLKFQQFHESTGRGIQDFYNLQKDWSKESEEAAITEYLKLTEKGITDEDIQLELDLIRIPTGDEEADFSDSQISERKSKWRSKHRKAIEFLKNKQEEFKTPLGNQDREQPRKLTADEVAELHKPYWNELDKSLEKFDDYSFNTSLGDISVKITPEEKKVILAAMRTQDDFFNDWKREPNESGVNIDTDRAVVDIAFRIPSIRERFLRDIISQTHTLTLEDLSKAQRNVDLDGVKAKKTTPPSVTAEVIDHRTPQEKQSFGQSVFQKRK